MSRIALAASLALSLLACESKSSILRAPYEGALPAVDPPLDAITHRLSRVRERLRLRGYRELPRQSRAFVIEGRPRVIPIDLPSGSCSTFVALGSASLRDLRLSMFDAEGATLATEELAGEAGLVHVCPQTRASTMPAYLAVEAREGAGTVALAELTSAPGEGDGFEGVFDDVLAPREPFADVEAQLASARSVLRARGFLPDGASTIASVAEGGSVHATHDLETGHCYLVMARAASSVTDADLFAFDAAGAEVARDIGDGSEPSFERCPSERETLAVEVRAFAGRGALGVQVLVGPGRDDGTRAETAPSEVSTALDATQDADDPSLTVGVSAAALARLGFGVPLFVAEHARIAPGDVVTHEAILGPGCSLVMAAASSDQIDVDLYLADTAGRELDADTAVRSSAVVRSCETSPSVRRIAVKAYGREGSYALAIVRAPASISTFEALRAAEAEAPFRARGFVPRESSDAELAEGEHRSRSIEVAAGRCVAVIAAGGLGIRDVDLVLSDASGATLASDTAPAPYASASACASADASLLVRCEVVAFRGAGRATLSVLDDALPDAGVP
jgi:hypothetical protein